MPPPVPAAIVPGVIVNTTQASRTAVAAVAAATSSSSASTTVHLIDSPSSEAANSIDSDRNERNRRLTPPSVRNMIEQSVIDGNESNSLVVVDTPNSITATPLASTSNTLSQNLIKMLYPLTNFSHQTNDSNTIVPDECKSDTSFASENQTVESRTAAATAVVATIAAGDVAIVADEIIDGQATDDTAHSLARTFAANVLFDPNTSSKRSPHVTSALNGSQSLGAQPSTNRTNDLADDTISVDSSSGYGIYPTPEPLVIPRLVHTNQYLKI